MSTMRSLFLALAMGGACAAGLAQNVVRGEYWLDVDPGWYDATTFIIDADNDTANVGVPIDLTGYAEGTHILGIRTLDDDGHWSLTNTTPIVVVHAPESPEVTRIEYFLNTDPGFAQGGTAWTGSTGDLAAEVYTPDLSGAVEGVNTLFMRTRNADGRWSLTNRVPVSVVAAPEQGEIDRAETFALSAQDPGFGAADAHLFSVPAEQLVDSVFNAPVPVTFQLGDTLMIRTHDSRGVWSLTNYVETAFSTSVAALENSTNITVGPNPFTHAVSVDPHGIPVRVFIYDPHGRLVYDHLLTGRTTVDLEGQSAGAYTAFFWKQATLMHRLTLVKQ